jgi:hypothetical protein
VRSTPCAGLPSAASSVGALSCHFHQRLPEVLALSKQRPGRHNDPGAFSNPSMMSSRYLRRPVRTHSPHRARNQLVSRQKSETMNPRRRRRSQDRKHIGPGHLVVALYCAMSPHRGIRVWTRMAGGPGGLPIVVRHQAPAGCCLLLRGSATLDRDG